MCYDWGALGYLADMHARDADDRTDPEGILRRSGTDYLVRRVLALNFVDYLAELPYFAAAVLPRLEQLGLRVPATQLSMS